MVPKRPGGLHQAQHGIQPVAGGIGQEVVGLGRGELQAQTEAGAPLLQRASQRSRVCLIGSSLL